MIQIFSFATKLIGAAFRHPGPEWAPGGGLGVLSAVVILLLWGGCAVKANGSLCYYYLQLPEPSQGLPQSFIRSYLDDQPIARFDNLTKKMKPLVPWMKEVEEEKFLAPEWVFDPGLKKLSKPDHPTEGFHTWQAILGCELREDGSKGRFFRYGYDGMDFITFKNETLTRVGTEPQAEQKLEENPEWSLRNKDYLDEICIVCLQEYLSYRKENLEYTDPPVGMVTHKVVNDSLEVLICQAFGFYSKKIQANWTRDGEICQNETLHRNVTPNSDGTYNVRLSIEIDPKERDRFQCHLNHEGLQKPLVLPLKEETATGWKIPVTAAALGAVILFLICKYGRHFYHKAKSLLDFLFSDTEEDEIQSESMFQAEITSEDTTSYGERSFQRAVEDSGSTVVAYQRPAQIVADPDEEEAGVVLHQQPVQPVLDSDSKEAEEDVVPEAGFQPSEPPKAPSSEESEVEEPLLNAQAHRAAKRQDLRKRSHRE